MKAKAGMFLIAISMIAFTGFGATTADPIQNSKDQVTVDFHADVVNVVTAEAVQIQNVVVAQSTAQTISVNVVVAEGSTQTISVNNFALKALDSETQLRTTYTLEVDYFPDGYSWCINNYNYLGNKDIFNPPSKTNLARDCTVTS